MSNAATSLPYPPRHSSALRWGIPLVAYIVLIPLCFVANEPGRAFHWLADRLGHEFYVTYIAVTVALIGATAYRRRGTPGVGLGWWVFDIALVTTIFGDVFKLKLPAGIGHGTFLDLIFNATRPYSHGVGDHGFPSGHTMFAFAIAFLVAEIDPRMAVLWYAFSVAVGWGRVESDAHWPYQVLCGAPMGIVMALAVSHLRQGVFLPRLVDFVRRSRALKAAKA